MKPIVFNIEEWLENPEKYPMIRNTPINALVPVRPMLNGIFSTSLTAVEDGSILIERDSGHWFAIPEDVFRKVFEVI